MTLSPDKEWWTAKEIAASGLPGLPSTPRRVNDFAKQQNWRAATKFARRGLGPGRGWEYSWKLFPNAAQRALLQQAIAPKLADARARDAARSGLDTSTDPKD